MVIRRCVQLLAFVLVIAISAVPAIALQERPTTERQEAGGVEPKEDLLYLRVTEERGRRISLEVAAREFERSEGKGPRVALVSIAHIGDKKLYDDIQKLLKDYDIVLYEAVTPPGVGRPTGENDAERAQNTEQTLRFIASVAEVHRQKHGQYPENLDSMKETAAQIDGVVVNWLKGAAVDAWGTPILYEAIDDGAGYRVVSFGADGSSGGEGFDADIEVDHTANIQPLQIERDNVQQQLATALSLSFQLAELDYTAPNWRHSDMDTTQLEAAFRERGVNFGLSGDAMAGVGFPAALGRMLLGLIGVLDRMMDGVVSDLAKIMMIELLGDQSVVEGAMGQMGAGFSEVLIDLRNQVTMDDLAAIIRDEPHVESVAILYGAAHMPDFERRLADQLEYSPAGERWIPAITVDIAASRLDPRQIQQMRQMMRRMLHQQMEQMRQLQRMEEQQLEREQRRSMRDRPQSERDSGAGQSE